MTSTDALAERVWQTYALTTDGTVTDQAAWVRNRLEGDASPAEVKAALTQQASEIRAAYHSLRELPIEQQPIHLYKLIGAAAQLDHAAGIKNAIPEDLREAVEQLAAEKIVSELNEYVKAQGPLPYAQAESEMARSLARQLMHGSKEVNLSQRYATNDQAAASERHQKALHNLMPLIQEAARNGYQIDYGQAIAQGIKQKEVLAISNGGFKMSSGG